MADDVERIRVLWSDLHGLAHGKYVPRDRVDHPTHYALTALCLGLDRDIIPIEGYAADVGFPDMAAVVDVDTVRPGWEPGTSVAMADLEHPDGRPVELDGRLALRRAIDAWKAMGYEPQLGYEMEFYVMEPDGSGGWKPYDCLTHRVYATGHAADPSGISEEIYAVADAAGMRVEGLTSEFHPAQMEVNLAYGDALEATDVAFCFRELAREVAARKGLGVTFLGRPSPELVGSGLHINISLRDARGGNAFDDPAGEHGLSTVCRQSIAGLLEHHRGLTAVSAPTVNAYKRLQPGMLAGYWANWGLDNRISSVRVPGERGRATRIECRMPDGSCSPYLAAAAALHAARMGVEAGLELGPPQLGDGDETPNTDVHVPESLGEALDAFEADTALCAALGDDLVRAFVQIKRAEWARWRQAITDWEIREYLPFF